MNTFLAQEESVQTVANAISYFDLLLLMVMIVAGLLLWLMGGRLVRGGCIVSGLIIGGLVGLVISEAVLQSGEGFYLAILTLGGAVAGALVAGLLFRFWMAFAGAVVFGVLFPSVAMVVFAVPGPEVTHDLNSAIDWKAKAREILNQSGETDASDSSTGNSLLPDKEGILDELNEKLKQADIKINVDDQGVHLEHGDAANDQSEDVLHDEASRLVAAMNQSSHHLLGIAGQWVGEIVDSQRAWWTQLDSSLRNRMILAAIAGVIFGLVVGLLFPTFAAALQTVVVGSILVLQPVFLLWAYYMPDQSAWLPQTWGSYVFWLLGASLVGVGVQLLLTRR